MQTPRTNGFSLIEIIVAGALIATTLGALFAVSTQVDKLSRVYRNRIIANGFAREGLEIARVIRDESVAKRQCEESICDDWRVGLFASSGVFPQRPAETAPIAKPVTATETGYQLGESILFTREQPCTDYLRIDHTGSVQTSQTKPPGGDPIWCRRLFIEEPSYAVGDKAVNGTAVRVRSQVAWLGSGRNKWRVMSPLAQENSCDTSRTATEWCLEYVTLLTDWRGI